MKINTKMLNIPPYISTTWNHVASLYVEMVEGVQTLVITLADGTRIDIPQLDLETMEAIFQAHAQFLEGETTTPRTTQIIFGKPPTRPAFHFMTTLERAFGPIHPLETLFSSPNSPLIPPMNSLMEHRSDQSNNPQLPEPLLKKISALTKIMGIDDPYALPKPEAHCNCFHCQIARALHEGIDAEKEAKKLDEEIVTEADLTFRSWDIVKTADHLYTVTDPLEPQKQYSVYLGDNVGCTCGENHCEHILAVLKS